MFNRFKKVKLPYRQPTEFERFRAFVAHEEREKSRQGMETFAEANDFDVPDEPDPLERFFDKTTAYEEAGQFMEGLHPHDDGFRRVDPHTGSIIDFDIHGIPKSKPTPAPEPVSNHIVREVQEPAGVKPADNPPATPAGGAQYAT